MGVKAVRLLSEMIIALITIIMACLSFYASQARLFNPQNFGFAALIALFTILILFINIFLAIYWASMKRAWFFVSFATICLFIPYITTMFQINISSTPKYKDKDICILTYNVHNFNLDKDYKTNFQDIAFSIAEKDPDIICFQEFWKNKDYTIDSISKFLDMPYYSLGENGLKVPDLAIFSKYPIEKTESQVYKNTHNGSMYCDINFKGKKIRIINCHLQTTNINQQREEINKLKRIAEPRMFAQAVQSIYSTLMDNSFLRANQALGVKEIIKTTRIPIIACGDLNETPSSYVYNQVKGDLRDGFKEAGRGFGGTYKKIFKVLRVDYIFHSKNFRCINYFSESLDYSDHNPVYGFYKLN